MASTSTFGSRIPTPGRSDGAVDIIAEIERKVKEQMAQRREEERVKQAERDAARAAERAKVDAILRSADEQKARLKNAVDSLRDSVGRLEAQRDAAAADLNAAETALAKAGSQVDAALNRAISAVQRSGALTPGGGSALMGIPEEPAEVDGIHLASAASMLDALGYALVDEFADPSDVASAQMELSAAFDMSMVAIGEDAAGSGAAAGAGGSVMPGADGSESLLFKRVPDGDGECVCLVRGDEDGLEDLPAILARLDHIVAKRVWPLVSGPGGSSASASGQLQRCGAEASCLSNGATRTKTVDNPDDNGRLLTATVFLNPAWEPSHGGRINLLMDSPAQVDPRCGRLLLHWSDDRCPHATTPATGWCYALRAFYRHIPATTVAVAAAPPPSSEDVTAPVGDPPSPTPAPTSSSTTTDKFSHK